VCVIPLINTILLEKEEKIIPLGW